MRHSQSPSDKKERLLHLLVQVCIGVLVALATWNVWYPSGYLVFSDFDFGINDRTYITRIFGLFNEYFSSTNFFNLSRLDFIFPFYLLSVGFGSLLPHFLLRSLILFCLVFSALSMFRLCRTLLQQHFGDFRSPLHLAGLMIPSLFYALNPWVIIRLQHIFLVVGYAFFPLVILYFLKLLNYKSPEDAPLPEATMEETGTRRGKARHRHFRRKHAVGEHILAVKLAFVFSLGCAAIHYFFYYSITMGLLWLVFLCRDLMNRSGPALSVWKHYWRKLLIMGLWVVPFISYWLIPYFASTFFLSIEPQNVNVSDTLTLFSRYSDIPHVLYLASYWWPMFNTQHYLDTGFWIGGGVFLALIAYTVFYRYGWHFYIRLFTWCAAVSLLIALGVNTAVIRDVNVFVVTKIPIIGHIFRDPNKLIGPMALFFAVLLSFGIDRFVHFLEYSGYHALVRISFILLLLLCLVGYYRPYEYIFADNYYAGRSVPKAYTEVQDRYLPGGKILWNPTMENMLVSNGISSYDWNTTDTEMKMKSSGDFHMYSSHKPTITQNEGNSGIISYLHSFIQSLLDTGGAQHLGSLLSWSGFNELGFHQDVYGQDERQQYNLKVLESQPDLSLHYRNDPIRLYRTPDTQADLSASNRLVYATNGLSSLMGLLDYRARLKLETKETALVWAPQRLQQPSLADQDLIVGDSWHDMAFPLLDRKFFSFPFQVINTGNPYNGWAKTYMKTPDWSWLIKSNHIQTNEWDYDYGEGIAYTYTSSRVAEPSYKADLIKGKPIVTTKDLWDNFFVPDNPSLFSLQYTPDSGQEDAVLSGTVSKYSGGSAIWQTAHSKRIHFDGAAPQFLRIEAVVSGIHAGKMHFKVKFLNEALEELQVAYINKDSSDANFTKARMYNDTAVPEDTRYMEVQLLSSDDTSQNIYFTIHDFQISDISASVVPNRLTVAVPTAAADSSSSYRTFIRLFRSVSGGSLSVADSTGRSMSLNTRSSENRLVWVDLGELPLNGKLDITPMSGLNVVNAVITIPAAQYATIREDLSQRLRGSQADISLVSQHYTVDSPIRLDTMSDIRTYPNTLMESFVPVTSGTVSKTIDILREGKYSFLLNGSIPDGSRVRISFLPETGGAPVVLEPAAAAPVQVNRSMEGLYNEVKVEENHYFLRLRNQALPGWDVKEYAFKPVLLHQGSYKIEMSVQSAAPNQAQLKSAHVLGDDEIRVPENQIDLEQNLLTYYMMNHETLSLNSAGFNADGARFRSARTSSPRWFIIGLNRIPVKKGQLLVFQAEAGFENLKNLHTKLMFLDGNGLLAESKYTELIEKPGSTRFYLMTEAPVDGWVQPCFFYNGNKDLDGMLTVRSSQLYIVDDLVKLESTAMLPAEVQQPSAAPELTVDADGFRARNARYVISNEAYHPIWQLHGDGIATPFSMNLLHNGFQLESNDASGRISIHPVLNGIYILFLIVSVLFHLAGAGLLVYHRLIRPSTPGK
ncbi:hypothetical protein [Gorillibacterium sp. sgz5001074]|uniref:hypothetical protein n=1 Tax=Gorillibacterium sp. sgz5001074 TaxID=3446695 RepID=UPI003F6701C3